MASSSRRYAATLAAVAGSPLLLAGCAGSELGGEEPATIVDRTVQAMGEVDTLHLSGALSQDGNDLTIDIDARADGDCSGAIAMAGGGDLEILSVGDQTYVKGDAGFWEQQAGEQAAAVQAIVGDKWVLLPGGGTFASFCDVQQLVGNIEGSEYEKLGDAEVDGADAVRLTSTGKSSTTIYVASEEPHHLLRIESQQGALTFSGFGEEVSLEAPPSAEVVDLSGAAPTPGGQPPGGQPPTTDAPTAPAETPAD